LNFRILETGERDTLSVLELNARFTSKVAKVILLDLGLWEFSAIFFGPTTRRQTETCNFTDEQNTDRRLRLQQLQSRQQHYAKKLGEDAQEDCQKERQHHSSP
jgi:hypothetical protein